MQRNARLDEAQAGIKIAGRNINNLIYADDTTPMAEIEEELKSLLVKVKEESEKAGLKLNIQKIKISPILSWQIDGGTMETVRDLIFLGSKITADGDCSHEIKRRLLLGRKAMPNLDNILKSRDITLPTKVLLVKAMVFPVVIYGCASWTLKKGERQRIDAFELWYWKRLLIVPWTARILNQLILKEISREYSLEGMMLKLKLQYFGHLMQRTDSLQRPWCWERLKAGGEGNNRGRDGWMASLPLWTWLWANSGGWWWTGKPGMLQSMGSQRVGHNWVTELNCQWKGARKWGPGLLSQVLWLPVRWVCVSAHHLHDAQDTHVFIILSLLCQAPLCLAPEAKRHQTRRSPSSPRVALSGVPVPMAGLPVVEDQDGTGPPWTPLQRCSCISLPQLRYQTPGLALPQLLPTSRGREST